jgi:hypothetical protein
MVKKSNFYDVSLLTYGDLDFWFGKLRPDRSECFLTKHLSSQFTIGIRLDSSSLCAIHVAPASQTLVQIVIIDAVLFSQFFTAGCGDFYFHARYSSQLLDKYKHFASILLEIFLLPVV